ncbi:peptidoglycan DD-metalloendopeptidase family protein [Pseudogulbenkiania sp. MAI-1]|uniref:peptidoglycan DD-metalloendopeptidase family protein n=1 Tax=Pseudogulbenkiania sp. MAI-1 TaxID=990370 RepID=UPI00045EA3DC|nr:peptidoglycan DD-metalloendopeptidase family protein [Pseudogulbenkiania sp. MAI-1]
MRIQLDRKVPTLITLLTATLLSGCSTLVQEAAPVESGAATTTNSAAATSAPAVTAPVANGNGAVATPYRQGTSIKAATGNAAKTHIVQPGENLFRISLNNGLKYQDVAAWNKLPDYQIKVGQVLRLTPPDAEPEAPANGTAAKPAATATPAATAPAANGQAALKAYPKALKLPYSETAAKTLAAQSEGSSAPAAAKPAAPAVAPTTPKVEPKVEPQGTAKPEASAPVEAPGKAGEGDIAWAWPVKGKVLRGYSDSNKGVDIGGRMGQPVLAASDGKVVYSGNGLRGYGKLIIIKHNKTFLSAYAHNSQLLVKEGQAVKKGQPIAEMGNTDADQVKLHFEIRRFGKPVDPLQYLDSTS